MSWYNKATYGKLPYLGQCDKLRSLSEDNEKNWHLMMARRKSVSIEELITHCDVNAILDDDDDIRDWGLDDPDTGSYRSFWGNFPCYFFQTAGFEYIWADVPY